MAFQIRTRQLGVSLGLSGLLLGCAAAPSDPKVGELATRVEKLEQQVKELQQSAAVASPQPTPAASPTPTPEVSVTPEPAAVETPVAPVTATPSPAAIDPNLVAFGDIAGKWGEKEIVMMAKLDVLDFKQGEFGPNKPITRAEFVRWLVKANNVYAQHGLGLCKPIRLSEHDSATFKDVPSSHPDFRYIQGMVDTGYVIGYSPDTFAPSRLLSREEMMGIKGNLDFNDNEPAYGLSQKWTDVEKISKKYQKSIYNDPQRLAPNIPRVFGSFKTFHPQQPVTRAEAAICITAITGYNSRREYGAFAADALRKRGL